MSDYLSTESLREMSPNDPISPTTVLPLAEAYEGCRENLEATLESEARNIERALKAEAANERLRASLADACEFGDALARCLNEFGPEQKNCIEALSEWRLFRRDEQP